MVDSNEFPPNSHIVTKYNHATGPHMSPDTFEQSNDIRLVDRCLNTHARYKIPDHIRQRMVDKLVVVMDKSEEVKHQLKAIQTLQKLDEANIKILNILKPKRSEQVRINVTKLTDEELRMAIRNAQDLLPTPEGVVDV